MGFLLPVDEFVDLLLVAVHGVVLHVQGFYVRHCYQADMAQDYESQDGFAGFGRAAPRQLLLDRVGDQGEQVDDDGHPDHVTYLW